MNKGIKTGLVLEGGSMRGLFSAGVMDVFLEEGISFEGMAGTSAGAIFGCNFKSRQRLRSVRYNCKYGRDPRYGSFRNLIRTGNYFGEDFAYHRIPNELDPFDVETYRENPIEFFITATDIERGEAVYFKSQDGGEYDIEWIRASGSMPLFSKIVEIDGYKLLDGGITDSIPIRFMEDEGYNRNVVILTQPEGYIKKKNMLMPLMKVVYRNYPRLIYAAQHRHEEYNEVLKYIYDARERGDVFVIQPKESLNISRIESDPKELKRVYKLGRKEAKRQLDEIKSFLER